MNSCTILLVLPFCALFLFCFDFSTQFSQGFMHFETFPELFLFYVPERCFFFLSASSLSLSLSPFFSHHRHSLSPFFSRTIFSKINQIQIIRVERVWLWVFTVHSNVLFLLSCSSGGVVNNNFLCNHPLLPFSNYCKYRLLISLIIFLQVAA